MRFSPLVLSTVLAAIVGVASGCTTISDDTARFFAQDAERQHEEFGLQTLERQYELFAAALTAWHPPHTRFAADLARNGSDAVPYLTQKLQEETDEQTQERIIFVFRVMSNLYGVELHKDAELMSSIESAIAAMETPLYKRQSEYSLELIAKGEPFAD